MFFFFGCKFFGVNSGCGSCVVYWTSPGEKIMVKRDWPSRTCNASDSRATATTVAPFYDGKDTRANTRGSFPATYDYLTCYYYYNDCVNFNILMLMIMLIFMMMMMMMLILTLMLMVMCKN